MHYANGSYVIILYDDRSILARVLNPLAGVQASRLDILNKITLLVRKSLVDACMMQQWQSNQINGKFPVTHRRLTEVSEMVQLVWLNIQLFTRGGSFEMSESGAIFLQMSHLYGDYLKSFLPDAQNGHTCT